MRPAFLRSRALDLCPFEPPDEGPASQAPWRLLSSGESGEPIAVAALDAAGRFLGAARLEGVDWLRREATLALRWSGPEAGMGEALRLMVGYAFDELNLDRVEARVAAGDEGALALLLAQGFRPLEGSGGVVQRLARGRA
ncbi:MAG TPA: GNAT family N-acetyltransferase [Candidatus Thermoplasmatota archaeon]|nr:GNAT family N-acetyltransferase [Candidatus Thermoplasmatota archaeon]